MRDSVEFFRALTLAGLCLIRILSSWRAYLSVYRDPANGNQPTHANQNCANTAPRGGAGRIYCFAR